jgi:hypothetical protein
MRPVSDVEWRDLRQKDYQTATTGQSGMSRDTDDSDHDEQGIGSFVLSGHNGPWVSQYALDERMMSDDEKNNF